MLVSALAGALLAIGASIHAFAAGARSHAYELAVLRASGWSERSLLRSMLGEHSVVVLVACAIGAAGGAAGIALTIPSVPEFTDSSWSLPLQYNLPAEAMATLGVVFAVALLLAGAAASLAMLRAAGVDRLRSGLT
jgi:ABC-type antimicrobial peptide transport system permease subunit